MKRVMIAGGLCGTTMRMASHKLEDRFRKEGIDATIRVHNLWEGAAVTGKEYDLIIEMFPYFEDLPCPVLSGKPFISHVGEKELINQIVSLLQ